METEIVYRKKLDRAPTLMDRTNKVGFEEFKSKLREAGWIGEDGDTVKIPFELVYEGNKGKGNNYIEWGAKLSFIN